MFGLLFLSGPVGIGSRVFRGHHSSGIRGVAMFLNGVFLGNSLYFRMFRDITPGLSLDSISSVTFLFSEPSDLIPVGVFFS